jgi:hypothetical protein
MDRDTKFLFGSLGVAIVILFLIRNKNKSSKKDLLNVKYAEPKQVEDSEIKDKENAVIGLKAMREAMDSKESKAELDKLNNIILKDYGVKIMPNKSTGLLRAMSKKGKVLAEETKE